MTTALSTAFKEWACVVKALAAGEQILILRKGGVHEKGKKFDVRHAAFFLFPTYEHQNPADLNPRGRELLNDILRPTHLRRHPEPTESAKDLELDPSASRPQDDGRIHICYFAEVVADQWVDDLEKLPALSPFHVWSEEAVRKRFDWGDSKGLFAIVARVFKLASEHVLENLPAYGGCRSWVDLKETVDAPLRSRMQPVLSDESFQKKFKSLKDLL